MYLCFHIAISNDLFIVGITFSVRCHLVVPLLVLSTASTAVAASEPSISFGPIVRIIAKLLAPVTVEAAAAGVVAAVGRGELPVFGIAAASHQ